MPQDALRGILRTAGLPAGRAERVVFAGGTDPILPTPFRIGVAGAATLAATGLAAADLWETRTGRTQDVGVDVRQATASLRSGHYMKLGDGALSHARNSIMGVYPAKNGRWSYIHANFPNHRAAALKVLGVPEDRGEVARAVATWDARDLEEAIIAAKGAGGMVRTMAEWRDHPQAAAIAALPLMEIVRIGDSPVEPLPEGSRPLSGIRVLDLTRVLAGPTCARTLAEHGAEVMKITAAHLPNLGYQEWDTGHGKLSAQLDLREPRAVETLKGLVRQADVFSQGYRPGTLGSRGLSPEELSAIRPGLVYVSLCAFGHTGPWASRRGFDTVVQTVSGITARAGGGCAGHHAGPAVLSGLGDRLLHGLPDGVRRDGGAEPARPGRRQLAGADIACAGWEMDRRSWRGCGGRPEGRAGGVHVGGVGALVDGQRDAVRPFAASWSRRETIRNPALLGSAIGSAGLSSACLARLAFRGFGKPHPRGDMWRQGGVAAVQAGVQAVQA